MSGGFALRNVGMSYGDAPVLRGVTLELEPPHLTALVGPNGAGKSTLLGILAGLREGYTGECRFNGKEVRAWKRRAMAQRVSFVPQSVHIEFPFTVEQVVMMGRAPHAVGIFEGEEDHTAAREAMELTGTWRFRARSFGSLSGGERQRVVLASALAQSPEVLLLDEPTSFLDLHHQIALYGILRALCSRGVLVVSVTHDLNLAAAYARRVVMLCEGEVVADGAPQDTLRPERLRDVFNVRSELLSAPDGGYWIRYGE